MAHTCDLSLGKWRHDNCKVETSLSYKVKLSQKKKKTKNIINKAHLEENKIKLLIWGC